MDEFVDEKIDKFTNNSYMYSTFFTADEVGQKIILYGI